MCGNIISFIKVTNCFFLTHTKLKLSCHSHSLANRCRLLFSFEVKVVLVYISIWMCYEDSKLKMENSFLKNYWRRTEGRDDANWFHQKGFVSIDFLPWTAHHDDVWLTGENKFIHSPIQSAQNATWLLMDCWWRS